MDEWDAVLSAMQTGPRDGDELLGALRRGLVAAQFAHVYRDSGSKASSLVAIARTALAPEFAEPCGLAVRDAVAFVVDTYEWALGGALSPNDDWPHDGPWHQPNAPLALLNRPQRVVVCGPAVTRLGLEVLGRGAIYATMHDPYTVRAARSLADWAARNRKLTICRRPSEAQI